MAKNILFLLLSFIIFINLIKGQYYFGNKLWVYWDKPIEQAPVFVRLCYQKIKNVCQKQKWQLTLLSQDNLHNFMPQNTYQQFLKIKNNSKLPFKQSVADLIRLTIIEQNGGVWIDISSILIKGLGWLENLQNEPYLITNYKKQEQPDMIQFYISNFQNRIEQRSPYNQLINYSPGYQIWFVSARKKSKAISEWRYWFAQFFQRSFQNKLIQFSEKNIFFRNLDHTDYMTGNKAFYYFLQTQQLKLDKNLTLFGQRKNLNKQLKIWALHGQYGPLAYALRLITDLQSMMTKTIEQVQKQYFQIKFYVKITEVVRNYFQKSLKSQFQFIKKNISFTQFINSNPSVRDCQQIKFTVEGSIMGFLFKENKVAKQLGLFTISIEERDKYQNYCKDKISLFSIYFMKKNFNKIIALASNIFQGSVAKRQYLSFYENKKELNLFQKINVVILANRMPIAISVIAFAIIMGLNFVLGLGVKIYCFVKNMIQKQIERNYKAFFLYLISVIISFVIFFCIDQFGGFDQELTILMGLIFFLCAKNNFKRQIHKNNYIPFGSLKCQQFYLFTKPFVFYYLGKSILLFITRRAQLIIPLSIIICLICPLFLQIGFKIQTYFRNLEKKNTNLILNLILSIKRFYNSIIIIFLIILYAFTNVKYIVDSSNNYMIQNFKPLLLIFFSILFLALGYEIIRLLVYLYKLNLNYQNNKGILNCIQFNRFIIIFMFTSLIIVSLSNLYFKVTQNQWILPPAQRILFEFMIIFIFMNLNLLMLNLNNISENNVDKKINQNYNLPYIVKLQWIISVIGIGLSILIWQNYTQQNFLYLTFIQWFILIISSILIIIWNRQLYQDKINQHSIQLKECQSDQDQENTNKQIKKITYMVKTNNAFNMSIDDFSVR